ncbi:restriction endonuclease subunit S [Megasphaera sp.]|uniref:restriction endonuclease subunit S n=1 Tax=Megasphaera sp. TaxID=2023260 RepID=UPI0035200E2C
MTKHIDIDTKAMRAKILDLAIRGRLTDQRQEDGNARDLLKEIQAEKERLIKEKKIKKEKPLPEITEEEKPFDIPENWEWVRLGNLTSKVGSGNTPKGGKNSGVYKESGVEFIREMNVYNDGLHYDGMVYISSELAKTRTGSAVVAGDILLNITGGSIGRCALVPDNFVLGNVNQHVLIIRNIVASLREYIHLVLCSPLVQRYINNSAVGDKAGLSASKTKGFVIPLPPLAEQHRIADKVSALFAQLDVIDKAYEEYQELQQAMKAKLLELAIYGKLTDQRDEDGDARDLFQDIQEEKQRLIAENKIKKEKPLPEIEADEIPFEIPTNWMWVRLGDLGAPIQYPFADGPFGSNLKKEHYTTNREVRIIQLSNIGENGWRDENVKYTTFEHLKLISRSEVYPGDIVIAKMMPAGRAIIVPDKDPKYVLSSDAVKFVPNKHLYLPFVIHCINSPVFQNQVTANVQGTTRKRTSLSKLKNCLLPIPPLAEQKRIVAKLDELLPLL